MVNLSREEGNIFYATSGKHECNRGEGVLGLWEITLILKSGDFYFKLGKYDSAAACKRTIDKVPYLSSGDIYVTLYAPLEKTRFTLYVIMIVTKLRNILKLAQSSLFRSSGRIYTEFSGIQSIWSDATAKTDLTGRPNFSLGSDGSRKFSE